MKAEKILLQVPDGLKRMIKPIKEKLRGDVRVWGGTCYGACDLPRDIGGSDVLVHVGHSEIPNFETDFPVIYLEGRSHRTQKVPENIYDLLEGKVALYSTVQYRYSLKKLERSLKKEGFEPMIGEGDRRIKYKGQVLGCDYSTKVEEADSHLYIGTGSFHPIGLSLSLDENIICFNPVTGELSKTEKKKDDILRKRHAKITAAKEGGSVGIVVSTKKGQNRSKVAERLMHLCEDSDIFQECMIAEFDEIRPSLVEDFDWDVMVNTACPRIALDDHPNYKTTVLTPIEFEIVLKSSNWNDWEIDEFH